MDLNLTICFTNSANVPISGTTPMELSFVLIGLFIKSRSPMIFHWWFCKKSLTFFPLMLHSLIYSLNLDEEEAILIRWPVSF
jgi:hypothetical protein